jgi:hypothetical protein
MTDVKVSLRESLTLEVKRGNALGLRAGGDGVQRSLGFQAADRSVDKPPIELTRRGNDWLLVRGSPIEAPIEPLIDVARTPLCPASNRQEESMPYPSCAKAGFE